MKCATILPTRYLHLIDGKPYHMALAHLIGKDKEYTEFYKKQAANGSYVILDNGVIETGVPMPIEEIVKCANIIGAHEIIIPDAFMVKDETIDNAIEAIPYAREHFKGKLMVVPQGETYDEWKECLSELLTLDIDVIGIPKVLTKILGRDGRLQALKDLGKAARGLEVHLLGCHESPLECLLIEKHCVEGVITPVRGVDSAIAYVYAREGMLITSGPRPSGEIHFDAYDADVEILERNIASWEGACEVRDATNTISLY